MHVETQEKVSGSGVPHAAASGHYDWIEEGAGKRSQGRGHRQRIVRTSRFCEFHPAFTFLPPLMSLDRYRASALACLPVRMPSGVGSQYPNSYRQHEAH
jgi:hypothetical protein